MPTRTDPAQIRTRLRELIAGSGLKQVEVAARADMDARQLSNVLVGNRSDPAISTVGRILAALGKRWRDLD